MMAGGRAQGIAVAPSPHENFSRLIEEVQSLPGPTGNIQTPSPSTVPRNTFTFGIHRFVVGFNYGLLSSWEAGLQFDLLKVTPITPLGINALRQRGREVSFHTKYRLPRNPRMPIDLAIGSRRQMVYAVGGTSFPQWHHVTLQGGTSYDPTELERRWGHFLALSHTGPLSSLIFDYETRQRVASVGVRLLLIPRVKLDLFVVDLTRFQDVLFDNFFFGLTISGTPHG
ncbi:MAG: hypothetical protein HYZ73_03630 [Elusimicrobia bacterium]|nr:hypothetical protein [Elusimicrobiota bacterium]